MDTEEAIGMVCIGREQPLEFSEAYEIIELLRRGEKYEKMWGEIEKIAIMAGVTYELELIRKQHFPKEEKE